MFFKILQLAPKGPNKLIQDHAAVREVNSSTPSHSSQYFSYESYYLPERRNYTHRFLQSGQTAAASGPNSTFALEK